MSPTFLNISVNFLAAFGFFYSAFLIYQLTKRKFNLKDFYYGTFWLCAGIFNASLIILALLQENHLRTFDTIFKFILLLTMGVHIPLASLYLIARISSRRTISIISGLLGALVFISFLFFIPPKFLAGIFGFLYHQTADGRVFGYFSSSILATFIIICLFVIWKESKTGIINFKNLSSFYSLYAIIIYASILIPYFLVSVPGAFFNLFYLAIPCLIYLSYGRKKAEN